MNFYPFHVGDYSLRTGHLEPLEDLAYRRLLDLYYVNEYPLVGTPAEIARLIRLRTSVDEVAAVLGEFFEDTPQGWRHTHCDEVIAQYHAKAKTAAENGKKGGRPKGSKKPADTPAPTQPQPAGNPRETDPQSQDKPGKTQSVNSANPAETGSKANQEPVTNNQSQEPPMPPKGAATGFDAFWSAYPLKKAKATAEKAWAKLKPSADLQAAILSAIAAHKLSADWMRDGGQYIPHPTTWLNQRRWEDEVTPYEARQHAHGNRPVSAVDAVKQAQAERDAKAVAEASGHPLAENDGAVWEQVDEGFRRVG